jgi:leader peptidase (prepilin peptidase)/N-methyltransferase
MTTIALTFALFGAIVGSFVGVVALRLPAGRGIVAGRSSCDACGTVLGPTELVPILSYLWQRGRCRHCRAAVAIDQLIAEVGCMLVGLLAALSADDVPAMLALSAFGWTLVALALLDARHHWLPDTLTLPLLIAGIAFALMAADHRLIEHIAGAILGYLLLEGLRQLYRRVRLQEGLGGGDSKLLAAIGAWQGVEALPWVVLLAALLGLSVVAYRRARGTPMSRTDRLPLGTFLAIAAITLMPVAWRLG